MRLVAKLVSALTLLLPIAGCSEVTEGPAAATLALVVTAGAGAGEDFGNPLMDVELCETDTENCALSDSDGRVSLEMPVGTNISYTVQKEGFASYLSPDVYGSEGSAYRRGLPTNDFMARQHERVEESPYPMRFTGTILLTSDLSGVTFELKDATGKQFYVDEEGNWNPDLTETASGGAGGFTQVSPGTYQIKISESASRCVHRLAWPGDDQTSLRLPFREGYVTRAHVQCQPQP